MAKDKKSKKDGKDGGKQDGSALKIPKSLRKAGKQAMKLAKEPVVTEIVAAALLSAAAALRGDKTAKAVGSKAGAKAADSLEAAAGASRQAVKLGDSLRSLALDLAHRTLESWERPPAAKGGAGKRKRAAGD